MLTAPHWRSSKSVDASFLFIGSQLIEKLRPFLKKSGMHPGLVFLRPKDACQAGWGHHGIIEAQNARVREPITQV
jgi:hypothetical protein